MNSALGVLLLAAAGLVAVVGYMQTRVSRAVYRLDSRVRRAAAPVDVSARLPAKVRDFALRADATPDDLAASVSFTQAAEMQLKSDGPWLEIDARQTVATGAAAFLWDASQRLGPVPKFRVVDGYVGGAGVLQVWLLGLVRVVWAEGADVDRGEAMRYLAELPWAPDAILGNPDLRWRMLDDGWAEVSLALPDGPVAVRFRFDGNGDIVEVFGKDRPSRQPDGSTLLRDWQGFFRDYRMVGPRRVPAEAEVGYAGPTGFEPYFQGRITGYAARH